MKYIIRLMAAVATVVVLAVGAASPALAATSPLPKIQTNGFNNWQTGWRVRPHTVVFGTFFEIKRLSYQHYNHRDAYGHGRLVVASGACCVHHYRASAYFYGPRQHSGPGKYFGHLRLRWRQNHKSHSMLLWINQKGQWWWRGA